MHVYMPTTSIHGPLRVEPYAALLHAPHLARFGHHARSLAVAILLFPGAQYRRGGVNGLSPIMFTMAVLGNLSKDE